MSPRMSSLLFALAFSWLLAPMSLAYQKNLPYNFTLAALNTTTHNTNKTGSPLVLGSRGAISGASLYVTSTWASYPYNDYPVLALVGGALRAFTKDGSWRTNATAVTEGSEMGWISSSLSYGAETDQYTAIHPRNHSRYATLAARGVGSLWSLCPSHQFRGQNEIVYNVSTTYEYYPFDVKDCYAVTLHIVPLHAD